MFQRGLLGRRSWGAINRDELAANVYGARSPRLGETVVRCTKRGGCEAHAGHRDYDSGQPHDLSRRDIHGLLRSLNSGEFGAGRVHVTEASTAGAIRGSA